MKAWDFGLFASIMFLMLSNVALPVFVCWGGGGGACLAVFLFLVRDAGLLMALEFREMMSK